MSLGIGLGAFAQGFGQGMVMGNQIKGAIDDRKMRKIQKEGTAAANAAREQDIAAQVQTTPNSGDPLPFKVGEQSFATMDDARKSASQQVGSVMDYYRKTTVPRLIQGYVDIGRPEQAQALQSWMESEESNGITRDWARAARMALLGDHRQAMKGFGKLYERLEPGAKYVGMEDLSEPIYEDITDKAGKVTGQKQVGTRPTGVRLKLKSATGEDISHDFGGTEDLYRTAMMTLSPDKFVARSLGEVDKAEAMRAAAAKDAREFRQKVDEKKLDAVIADQRDERQHQRTIVRDDRQFVQQTQRDATQQGYDLERIMTTKQMEAAIAPALEAAKAKGDTPEDARKAIGAIWKSLAENAIGPNAGFAKLPVEEQVRQATNVYREQSTAAKGVVSPRTPAPQERGIPKLW